MDQMQREKIEARLTAVRQQQNRSPSNLIHVQSRVDESGWEMNEEERETTKRSIQRLQREDGQGVGSDLSDGDDDAYQSSRATPLYGGSEKRERVPTIEI